MLEELRVGIVGKPHGLKGELKVFPTTDDPKRFSALKEVILKKESKGLISKEEREEREISAVRYHKGNVLLSLKGIDSIELAEKYRDYSLYVKREDALSLAEGEYFLGDYLGMEVFIEGEESLGQVSELIETGANLVFVVKGKDKEYLIPHVPAIVYSIENNRIHIHTILGLLEL